MPVYEYRCNKCKKRSSFFVRSVSDKVAAVCSACGSTEMERLISAVAYHKSMSTVWEQSGEPSMNQSDDYYKDPRNIGRWTEKRLAELGVDMPDETRKMIDAAREGEMPGPVKDL